MLHKYSTAESVLMAKSSQLDFKFSNWLAVQELQSFINLMHLKGWEDGSSRMIGWISDDNHQCTWGFVHALVYCIDLCMHWSIDLTHSSFALIIAF